MVHNNALTKVADSVQVTTATLSCVSSTSLAIIIILKIKNGLKSPYRRIIFAICVSDILQSIGLLIGPFVSKRYLKGLCVVDGLMITSGSLLATFYSTLLSIYYYYKLHKNVTDEAFARIERKMHYFIALIPIILNTVALATDSIHPSATGNVCYYAPTPTGCRQHPDEFGECDTNDKPSAALGIIVATILPFFCLATTILLLAFILRKIVLREKIFSPKPSNLLDVTRDDLERGEEVSTSHHRSVNMVEEICTLSQLRATPSPAENCNYEQRRGDMEEELSATSRHRSIIELRENRQRLSLKYKREMMMQLILYGLTFIATYGMFAVASLISGFGEHVPFPFVVYLKVMFPLQGLFTIIIFLRPASCVTKHRLELKSWTKAFWIVFKNGGVSPSDSRNNTAALLPIDYMKKRNQSVKFGIANDPSRHVSRSDIFSHFTSERLMIFNSNSEMSKGNACYNSEKNWFYVVGGTDKPNEAEEKVASNSACSQNGDSSNSGGDSPGLTMDVGEKI